MIGALAIKNRRRKLQRNESQASQVATANVFTQRCNILFVASGVFLIVGLIVLIPVCFGDTNFLIYSGSSFLVGIIIFIIACLFNPTDGKDVEDSEQVRSARLREEDSVSRVGSSVKRYTRSSNGIDVESGFTAEVDLKTEVTAIASATTDADATSHPLQATATTASINHWLNKGNHSFSLRFSCRCHCHHHRIRPRRDRIRAMTIESNGIISIPCAVYLLFIGSLVLCILALEWLFPLLCLSLFSLSLSPSLSYSFSLSLSLFPFLFLSSRRHTTFVAGKSCNLVRALKIYTFGHLMFNPRSVTRYLHLLHHKTHFFLSCHE